MKYRKTKKRRREEKTLLTKKIMNKINMVERCRRSKRVSKSDRRVILVSV